MTTSPFTTGAPPTPGWTIHDSYVSLARKQAPPKIGRLAALPVPLEIDFARTALVVIDMQNDFCHPEGWFGGRGIDVSPMRRPIPVIADLTGQLRNAGARIVWLNWGLRADCANLPPSVLFRGKRSA